MMNPNPMSMARLALLLSIKLTQKPCPLIFWKPFHGSGPIRQQKNRCDSSQDRSNPLEDKNPPPSRQPKPLDSQQLPGNNRSHDIGKRNRRHESGDGLGAIFRPKPKRKIKDD